MNITFQQIFGELQKLAAKEVQLQSEPEGAGKGFLNNLVQQKDEAVVRRYVRAAFNEVQRYLSAAIHAVTESTDTYTIKWTKSYTDRAGDTDLQRLIVDCVLDSVMREWTAEARKKYYQDALKSNLAALSRMVYAMPMRPRRDSEPIPEDTIEVIVE